MIGRFEFFENSNGALWLASTHFKRCREYCSRKFPRGLVMPKRPQTSGVNTKKGAGPAVSGRPSTLLCANPWCRRNFSGVDTRPSEFFSNLVGIVFSLEKSSCPLLRVVCSKTASVTFISSLGCLCPALCRVGLVSKSNLMGSCMLG